METTTNLPLPLELSQPMALNADLETVLESNWGSSRSNSNSHTAQFGLINVDDVQVDDNDIL